jgi:putative transposase
MPYDPYAHHRQSTRLRTWDYAGGAYFVTLCAHVRACLFGEIVEGEMRVSDAGRIALPRNGYAPESCGRG